jgi:voltage-gated potassium channel
MHHIERVRELLDLDEEEAHLIMRLLQHHHKVAENTGSDEPHSNHHAP